jgi:hypothetical protein
MAAEQNILATLRRILRMRWGNAHALITIPRYRGRRRALVAQQALFAVGEVALTLAQETDRLTHAAADGLHKRTVSRERTV